MKKLFALLFAVVACTTRIFATEWSGQCGDNLTWYLNSEDSVFIITGSGEMSDCKSGPGGRMYHNLARYVKELSLPEGLTYIGEYAFCNFINLKSVVIPQNVTKIAWCAFDECYSLESVVLPDNLYSIGYSAFGNCVSLLSITLPTHMSLINLDSDVFKNVPNVIVKQGSYIQPYEVGRGVKCVNGYVDGMYVYTDDTKTDLRACSGAVGDTAVIAPSVKKIRYNCFDGCTGINTIVWNAKNGDALGQGDDSPFYGTGYNYTSFVIGEQVDTIPAYLWSSRIQHVASVTIPANVKYIDNYAFYNAGGLKDIIFLGPVPPERHYSPFSEYMNLYAPCGALEAYKEAWEYYASRIKYQPNEFTVQGLVKSSAYGKVEVPQNRCENKITAVANEGYHFAQWTDGVTDNPRTIVLTQDTTFTAEFALDREGKCGTDLALTWRYDLDTRTLTISGEGALMDNLYFGEEYYNAQHLVIEEGITAVAGSAFWGFNSLQTVEWNAKRCDDFEATNTPFYYYKPKYYMNFDYRLQITSFTFGNDVEYIPAYLCSGMTAAKIRIMNCKTTFGENALTDCNYSIDGFYNITLPDTTVCYGQMVSFSDNISFTYGYMDDFEPSKWDNYWAKEMVINHYQVEPYDGLKAPYSSEFNADQYIADHPGEFTHNPYEEAYYSFNAWYEGHFHQVNNAAQCPEGKVCEEVSPDGQVFYADGILTRTYTTVEGCDSILTRKVFVNKATAPYLIAIPVMEYENSGKIELYDIYCTEEEYVGYDQGYSNCGPYNHVYTYARYAYFTVDGERYSRSNKTNGKPSYNDTWSYTNYCGDRPLKNPDYTIYNLSEGWHKLVFYTDCDSVEVTIEVASRGICINGVYYLLDPFSHTAEVTFRGEYQDSYQNTYSGNVTIPKSVVYKQEEYSVTNIGQYAFWGSRISSITMESENPMNLFSELYYDVDWHTYQGTVYVPYGSLDAYRSAYYWRNCKLHVLKPESIKVSAESPTSISITLGDHHIISCGVYESDNIFAGNIVDFIGLEPNNTYRDVPFFANTREGDYDTIHYSFKTSELILNTQNSKAVSESTAILFAETNISEAETNCGFEWMRTDAPEGFEPTPVYAPVANGTMAGRLQRLKDDVYYKYRAFYESAAGNKYYGEWKFIFTGDVAVEFDPILYTYAAVVVMETEATLKGYALAGSEDFDEQGFEYWAESRVSQNQNAPRRMPAELNEHVFVKANGITMSVTLTDLDPGTIYKYRAYAKVGEQIYYGTEQMFITPGTFEEETPDAIDQLNEEMRKCENMKILRDGQIYIMYEGKMYNVQGQEVR